MAKKISKGQSKDPTGKIELSPPWLARYPRGNISTHMYPPNIVPVETESKIQQLFIIERTRVHEEFIHESEKTKREIERTKRTGLWLASALIAIACALPIFAPEGRETMSYWLSISLFVFAAGAMGYTTISIRSKKRNLILSKPKTSN
jgi:hypothetical protein